jgi:hypothetical protein
LKTDEDKYVKKSYRSLISVEMCVLQIFYNLWNTKNSNTKNLMHHLMTIFQNGNDLAYTFTLVNFLPGIDVSSICHLVEKKLDN